MDPNLIYLRALEPGSNLEFALALLNLLRTEPLAAEILEINGSEVIMCNEILSSAFLAALSIPLPPPPEMVQWINAFRKDISVETSKGAYRVSSFEPGVSIL